MLMEIIKIKGIEYKIVPTKDSYSRRVTQYANKIIESLSKIGIKPDDVNVSTEASPMTRTPASAHWYVDGFNCHFTFNKMPRFVDNLLVVSKVIEYNVNQLILETITPEEFISSFKEDRDFENKRIEARKFFELSEDHVDMKVVSEKYKKLARDLHPDMPNGDEIKFKELNEHHKILKRELE